MKSLDFLRFICLERCQFHLSFMSLNGFLYFFEALVILLLTDPGNIDYFFGYFRVLIQDVNKLVALDAQQLSFIHANSFEAARRVEEHVDLSEVASIVYSFEARVRLKELHFAFNYEIDFAGRIAFFEDHFLRHRLQRLEQWNNGHDERRVFILEKSVGLQSSVVHRQCHFAAELQRQFLENLALVFNGLEADFGIVVLDHFSQPLPHFSRQMGIRGEGVDVKKFMRKSLLTSVDLADQTRQVADSE